jgi:hypothetical protein
MKHIKNSYFAYLAIAFATIPALCQAKTITLFSHGIADKWSQVHRYVPSYTKNDVLHRNERYVINTPYVSFNYPDATNRFYRVNYNETSFGQENEIGRLYKAYENIKNQVYQELHNLLEDIGVILFGVSRGASNQLIFAGRYVLDKVKAIILESPYHTMGEVIESIMHKKNAGWLPLSYGETVAEFIFKKYTRYGHSPANCLKNISQDIPILIVCSEEDHLVPCSSSINVYKKLVECGHKHVYIFIAKQGRHAAILQGPEGEKYQLIVNAFYKKYNLPHNPSDAEKGESLLALCQPAFNELS